MKQPEGTCCIAGVPYSSARSTLLIHVSLFLSLCLSAIPGVYTCLTAWRSRPFNHPDQALTSSNTTPFPFLPFLLSRRQREGGRAFLLPVSSLSFSLFISFIPYNNLSFFSTIIKILSASSALHALYSE